MTGEDERRIQFPIVSCPARFVEQERRGCLKFVDPAARALIEARQPYEVATHTAEAHLMRIASLDNTDKHRAITAVAHAITVGQIGWPADLSDTQPERHAGPPPPGQAYGEAGTEIFRFVFASPQREMDVPCDIGFGCVLVDVVPPIVIWANVEGWIKTVRIVAEEIACRFLP
jgi:hypothetical protein